MTKKSSCEVCFEPVCTSCGIAFFPVWECQETKSRKKGRKQHK